MNTSRHYAPAADYRLSETHSCLVKRMTIARARAQCAGLEYLRAATNAPKAHTHTHTHSRARAWQWNGDNRSGDNSSFQFYNPLLPLRRVRGEPEAPTHSPLPLPAIFDDAKESTYKSLCPFDSRVFVWLRESLPLLTFIRSSVMPHVSYPCISVQSLV